jgi:hypothetical protein
MPPRKAKPTTNNANDKAKSGKDKKKEKFEEPKIKWADSKAKADLYKAIMEGSVPLESYGADELGHAMTLKEVFTSVPELALYDYTKLSSRLSSLRTTITDCNRRAAVDQDAYDNFKEMHRPTIYSKKGYIQWQGSKAKKQLKKDIKNGLLELHSKQDLWELRPVYYSNFPLKEFRDKINQTLRTDKYMYTLKIKGKQHKSS